VATKRQPFLEALELRTLPSTIPFSFINNTGRPDSHVHIALFGQDVSANSTTNPNGFFYVDETGNSHALYGASLPYLANTTLSGNLTVSDTQVTVASTAGFPTSYTPNFPILIGNETMLVVGPGSGNATWNVIRNYNGQGAQNHTVGAVVNWDKQYVPNFTLDKLPGGVLNLPSNTTLVSGRMLFGVGSDVFAQVVTDNPQGLGSGNTTGVSAPAANSASDPNFNHTYDFFELTLKNQAINGNLTQIDQFGMPIQLQLTPPDLVDAPHGVGALPSRDQVISNNSPTTPGFAQFVQNTPFTLSIDAAPRDANGKPRRILSPADVLTLYPVYYQTASFNNNSTVAFDLITTNVLSPGMLVSGTGIAANTTVAGIRPPAIVTGNTTLNSTLVGGLNSTLNLRDGMAAVSGNVFAQPNATFNGTVIASINAANSSINVNAPAIATQTDTVLTFIDNSSILLSHATTASAANTTLTFTDPNYDTSALANYFNGVIQQLFETGNNTLTLTVPNPGYGAANNTVNPNDPANYTFNGTRTTVTVPNMLGANQTYNVFSFNGTVANQTITLFVYEPLFASNTANASYPLAPQFLVQGTNTIASGLETPGAMVFGCDGTFADNTLQFPGSDPSQYTVSLTNLKSNLLGNIENQIVSAINRGVALRPTSEWGDVHYFYKYDPLYNPDSIWNYYAQYFHEQYVSIDGKTYGFAYDDQKGQSSDFGMAPLQGMLITLGSWEDAVNVLPPAQIVAGNATLPFSDAANNSIRIDFNDAVSTNLVVSSGSLSVGSTANVTITGSGSANLTLTGPADAVNQALQSLVYQPSANGTQKLTVTTANAANGTPGPTLDVDSLFIQVQSLTNTPPSNSVPGNQSLSSENSILFSLANGNAIQVRDLDAGNGNLTVSLHVTAGTLAYAINYGVAASGYGTQNLTFTGPLDKLNATLDTLFYQPAASGNATLTVTTNDNGHSGAGGAQTDIDSFNLLIQPPASHVNVAAKVNVPASHQFVVPGVPLAFNAAQHNAITVSDPDAGYREVEVTLAALHGVLNLGTTVGLTFVGGTTNNSSNLAFRGRLDHINYNLRSLTYTSLPSYSGADTLTASINDLGNTGTGGATTDIRTVQLASAPLAVNQPPAITVPAAQIVVAGKALLFSAANNNPITLADPDAGNADVEVNLRTDVGTLAIAIAYNVAYTGYGTNNLTLTGTLANINKTLGTLFFQAPSAAGNATLTIVANDLNNLGAGGPRSDSATIPIAIQSPTAHNNAAPTVTAPDAAQNATMNGTLAFTPANNNALAFGDIDAGYDAVLVTLTVGQGTLEATPLGAGGPTVSGNGTATLSLRGRIDHINYILQSLRYRPTLGFTGADTLSLLIDDEGRNGLGGPRSASDLVSIQVG
jgi:hypothetical protein